MPTIAETILVRLRAWILAELALTADQVMLASRGPEPGPFSTPPCLVLDLTNIGEAQGMTYRAQRGATDVTVAQYLGVVEVLGYGQQAADWITQLAMQAEVAGFDGFDLVDTGTTLDASQPTATGIEQIYVREFQVAYAVRIERPGAVAALTANVALTTTPPTTP
jgi:hypothetical protein